MLFRKWSLIKLSLIFMCAVGLSTAYSQPVPSVTVSVPAEVFIGENFSFTVAFDNTGTVPGYGPFIDLVFPYNGADGAAGTDTPDGMDFLGATYLGVPVTAIVQTFPDADGTGPGTTGCVTHPFAVDNTGTPL